MIVLSWDVGIINLAYCLLSYENDNWKILDWGNLDLLGKDRCYCKCGANPKLYYDPIYPIDPNDPIKGPKYFCKRCAKKLEINVPTFDACFKLNTSDTCCWQNKKTLKKCNKMV